MPKTDNTVKEVPSQSKAFRDKRSNTESEHTHQSVNQTWSAELAETSVPDKDSKIICDILLEPESSKMSTDSITESEKVNVSNVEFALTVSGSSSDFGIKENEFLAECKDTGKESSVESDAGSNIKEHSFLSSAEVISSPDKKERLFKNTKKDESSDSSEMEEGLMKLNVKSDNITNVIETEHSEPDTEKEEHVTEYNMETDTSVRENENNVSDDIGKRDKEIVEGLQGGDEKTACDNELSFENNHFEACDNSDMVTRQDEFGAGSEVGAVSKVDAVSEVGAISELGAVGNVNTCEESGDKQVDNDHNDSECNEQEKHIECLHPRRK